MNTHFYWYDKIENGMHLNRVILSNVSKIQVTFETCLLKDFFFLEILIIRTENLRLFDKSKQIKLQHNNYCGTQIQINIKLQIDKVNGIYVFFFFIYVVYMRYMYHAILLIIFCFHQSMFFFLLFSSWFFAYIVDVAPIAINSNSNWIIQLLIK